MATRSPARPVLESRALSDPRPGRPRLLLVAAALVLASVAAILWIDEPLARWVHAHGRALVPFWLATTDAFDRVSGLELGKYFAATVFVAAGLVAATHLASLASIGGWKELFGRLRPVQWLERGQPEQIFSAGGFAFPSGHVSFYLSLCLPLALLSARWRPLFLAVPVVVACARIGAEQHFLSDTLAAAAWVAFLTWTFRELFERRGRAAPGQRP